MPTFEQEIIREAQRLARLRLRARNLRKDLKQTNAEINHCVRLMRKLVNAKTWQESGVRSKLTPEG